MSRFDAFPEFGRGEVDGDAVDDEGMPRLSIEPLVLVIQSCEPCLHSRWGCLVRILQGNA